MNHLIHFFLSKIYLIIDIRSSKKVKNIYNSKLKKKVIILIKERLNL